MKNGQLEDARACDGIRLVEVLDQLAELRTVHLRGQPEGVRYERLETHKRDIRRRMCCANYSEPVWRRGQPG